jgi:hypothetical protein
MLSAVQSVVDKRLQKSKELIFNDFAYAGASTPLFKVLSFNTSSSPILATSGDIMRLIQQGAFTTLDGSGFGVVGEFKNNKHQVERLHVRATAATGAPSVGPYNFRVCCLLDNQPSGPTPSAWAGSANECIFSSSAVFAPLLEGQDGKKASRFELLHDKQYQPLTIEPTVDISFDVGIGRMYAWTPSTSSGVPDVGTFGLYVFIYTDVPSMGSGAGWVANVSCMRLIGRDM